MTGIHKAAIALWLIKSYTCPAYFHFQALFSHKTHKGIQIIGEDSETSERSNMSAAVGTSVLSIHQIRNAERYEAATSPAAEQREEDAKQTFSNERPIIRNNNYNAWDWIKCEAPQKQWGINEEDFVF